MKKRIVEIVHLVVMESLIDFGNNKRKDRVAILATHESCCFPCRRLSRNVRSTLVWSPTDRGVRQSVGGLYLELKNSLSCGFSYSDWLMMCYSSSEPPGKLPQFFGSYLNSQSQSVRHASVPPKIGSRTDEILERSTITIGRSKDQHQHQARLI